MTVSTRELVLHKPHVNYYMNLDDIVSITPSEPREGTQVLFVDKTKTRHEIVSDKDGTPCYVIYTKQASVHNRSGLYRMSAMRFVVPIGAAMLQAIAQLGNWDMVLDG